MNESYRREAAIAETENALAILRQKPALDPVMRRAELQRAASGLYKAADLLTDFGEPEVA